MDRFFEFALNHPELVGTFVVLLVLFFVLEKRRGGKTVSTHQLTHLLNKEDGLVLDIRDSKDFSNGHITGAKNIPFSQLQDKLSEIAKFKDKPVILVCKMGQHSGAAGKILHSNGFLDVRRLSGGITTWSGDGLPLVKGK